MTRLIYYLFSVCKYTGNFNFFNRFRRKKLCFVEHNCTEKITEWSSP